MTQFHSILTDSEVKLVLAIENNQDRKRVLQLILDHVMEDVMAKEIRLRFPSVVHPRANVSKRLASPIGEGTVIMPGATINSCASIGRHCIINTNASVDHDCVLEDFVHISPGVSLAGNVSVGEGTHIGIGASVIQGIKIGSHCTIGAGAVIIRDVPDGAKVVGNPGRVI